ncbi:MAG TPA: hypothetical protein VFH51_08885, partial [Myxococcota bacterium]|nr:hypothetical protein [Myxococcota bacterium]
ARGCSWMYQGMDGTRRMVALARACPESLAISPDGRQGAMALPGEVQVIRGGDHKALPVPGSGTWSAFYGADATLRVASQADGVAREYAWDGSAWRVAATEAQSRPQDCRVLASASPTTATLDDCASAEPEPLDMAVLGKVRGRYPTVGGWALVRGAHGDVILAQHPEAAGVRNVFFAGPVLFRRGQELTAPLALQHGSPEARIRVVTRGAYALMSVDDAGTFRGKTFRLFDMRTGELLQTFANGVHAVQFWPSTRPWDATSAPIRAEGPLTVR